ncbi:MAG: UDP-glucose 4-epimerase GalE [Ruminococcaceae bacterium]|nr:UDP-glucose 4-epimerase GalE [Oscillospiraceae bacterium]
MSILVTGGAGYIGSHTCVLLLEAGYDVVVLDNLSNSSPKSIGRVEKITGKKIKFYECDILDKNGMRKIFKENDIDAVIHFAGLKAVGESVAQPLKYYENNISGTVCLLEVMNEFNVKKMVFSSSATVYGMTDKVPLTEDLPTSANSPYGQTKLMIEQILTDLAVSDKEWSISLLRYFNPVGAHESGSIGENPKGIPNNLMPYITQVASGKLEQLSIFGNDYPTKDGTGVRDYIHVVDLADGHLKALDKLNTTKGVMIHNLGTGVGYSVLDLVNAFQEANNLKINYKFAPRRPGDVVTCYADPSKAKKELGWEAKKSVVDMCRDSWNWQKNNPNGYDD